MEERDKQLWRIAQKRAKFKKHLASYIIVNGFLWAMWYITDGRREHEDLLGAWPIWCTLGWGIGIAFSYYDAYHDSKEQDTMKEYQKLKDRENK
jgi:2TM domain